MYYGKETSRTAIKVPDYAFLQNIENSEPNWSRRGAPGGPGAPLARPTFWPRREAAWAPRSPSLTPLWLVTFLLLQKFLLLYARIVPATYLAISGVFFSICFCQGKELLLEMSSCGSSGEDFMGRRLREVQKDLNQGKYVDWATEEEIAARRAEMERSVREEVKIITASN